MEYAPGHVGGKLGPKVPIMVNAPDQWIAESGLLIRCEVGSGVHGMAIAGTDDRDEMGICVEPWTTVIGSKTFGHYGFRTAEHGKTFPKGESPTSGPDDLDLIVYGLRRWARLAAKGTPTVLTPLWVPDSKIEFINDFGKELRELAPMFASKSAGQQFKGYLRSQRDGLMGKRSGGTRNRGRADLRAKYGFDTKFAAHMVRLGIQGVEYMKTGKVTLPMEEPDLTWLRDLKQGRHTLEEALARAETLEAEISKAQETSKLPDHPDRRGIDYWLSSVHRRFWGWV